MKIDKCVGCGFCCLKAPCVASKRLYPSAKICPALYWDGEKHRCKLMELPGNVGLAYRQELYAGEGCCCNLNDWRKDIKNRIPSKDNPTYTNPLSTEMQIFFNCLGKEWISRDALTLAIYSFVDELEKREYPEEKVKAIALAIQKALFDNRNKFVNEFMG